MSNLMFDAVQAGNRKPVWQFLGSTFDTNISVSDGLQHVNGDFEIIKAPMKALVDDHGGRRLFSIPDKFCIMRELDYDNYAVFGQCSSSFQIIQRRDLAKALDELTLRWPLETMGMLKNGKTMFVVLNAGMMEIKKDPVNLYFMFVDTVDGGTALKCIFTPIRLHCYNALISGIRASVVNASIEHRNNLERDFHFTVGLANKMANAQVSTVEQFELMANKVLTPEQASRIFAAAYPEPKKPSKISILDVVDQDDESLVDIYQEGMDAASQFESMVNRSIKMREAVNDLYIQLSDEYPNIGGTAYAAYNAVVELADWRTNSESANVDTLFGQRANEKKRAFKQAMKE